MDSLIGWSDCLYLCLCTFPFALYTATDTYTIFFPRVCLSVSLPAPLSVFICSRSLYTLHSRTHTYITLTPTHTFNLLFFTHLCCRDPITSLFLFFFFYIFVFFHSYLAHHPLSSTFHPLGLFSHRTTQSAMSRRLIISHLTKPSSRVWSSSSSSSSYSPAFSTSSTVRFPFRIATLQVHFLLLLRPILSCASLRDVCRSIN